MEKVVVVTGASGGIGFETARLFAAKGFRTYGISRTGGVPEGVVFLRADLTDDDDVRLAFERIRTEAGRIDILINNAGAGVSGAIELTEPSEAMAQFDINFFALHRCVRYAVPLMRAGGGRIVNVSSAAAAVPIPFQAFYAASKAAVNSFSLTLGIELRPFGIRVCAVMPGDVRTGFTAARRKSGTENALYHGADARAVAAMERDEERGMRPGRVAERLVQIALRRGGRPLYVIGFRYRLLLLFGRALPARVLCHAVEKLYINRRKGE